MDGPWRWAWRGQHETVSSKVISPRDKLLFWQRPHTDKHALCRRAKTSEMRWNAPSWHMYTNTQLSSADMVSGCRAQQDWNAAHCFRGHLPTIDDCRQLARQCLHAGLFWSCSLLALVSPLGKQVACAAHQLMMPSNNYSNGNHVTVASLERQRSRMLGWTAGGWNPPGPLQCFQLYVTNLKLKNFYVPLK